MSVKAKADESEGEKAALQDHIKTLKVMTSKLCLFPLYFPPSIGVFFWGMTVFVY